MNILEVCAGISGASVAWSPLGWNVVAFSEIDSFACSVLRQHYPDIPNWGNLLDFERWPDGSVIDVLCGGTPCQSFSVAGDRAGMDDPRGNLMLTFCDVAGRYRPRWLVWENVPGVLSSNGGRDFGAFLGMLGKLGYGFAYRVFDAQYFDLAQRRARVFVVGCIGNWRGAAAVLFDSACLSGYQPPGREKGQVAPTIPSRSSGGGGLGTDFDCDGGLIVSTAEIAGTLNANGKAAGSATQQDALSGMLVVTPREPTGHAIAFDCKASGRNGFGIGAIAGTQRAMSSSVNGRSNGGGHQAVLTGSRVRRLTPRECERLQGFPDDYTLVSHRGKPARDGPRYRAIGNAWPVTVVRWIGRRIEHVDRIECANA